MEQKLNQKFASVSCEKIYNTINVVINSNDNKNVFINFKGTIFNIYVGSFIITQTTFILTSLIF